MLHAAGAADGVGDELLGLGVEPVGVALLEQREEAGDGEQRRRQVVRGDRRELVELAVRALELAGVALELALGGLGALERGLLLGDQPDVLVAQVLVEPPRDDRAEAGGADVGGVEQRPAPRVRLGVGVVEDRMRVERAADAVVQHDERRGEQEDHPVLVEREQHDHDEEVEVRLDDAAGEVDDHRRGRQEAERDEQRTAAAARADDGRRDGADRDGAALEQAVADADSRARRPTAARARRAPRAGSAGRDAGAGAPPAGACGRAEAGGAPAPPRPCPQLRFASTCASGSIDTVSRALEPGIAR